MVISFVEIILLVLLGPLLLYLLLLSLLAHRAHLRSSFVPHSMRRFAFVVPAHNEALTIARTLKSLFEVDYPRDLFEVVVIADNCTDPTASVARAGGAKVLERTNNVERGKGYALRWCFDRLAAEGSGYDAVSVIDADSVVSKNFLKVLNWYFEAGARALQSSDLVEPQPGAWSAEAIRLGFTLYNYVRPLGRRVLGGHAGARGNGMGFSVQALRSVPWNAYSQNEDLEYGLNLLLSGIKVEFAPEATVWATMPATARNTESQRSRWEAGRFPIIKKYSRPLLRATLAHRSFAHLDAFLDLVTPALVNLIAVTGLLAAASICLALLGISGTLFAILWVILCMVGVLHMVIGLLAPGVDRSLVRTLAHIPRYALWKMMVYAKLVLRGHTREWVRTTRETTPPAAAGQKDAQQPG